MIIKDPKGAFELKVDKQRRIVFEKNIGSWKTDDFERFDSDYMNKVIPYLGAGAWAKLCDLREYLPSTIVSADMIGGHIQRCVEKGYKCAAILVDSATLKMQITRTTKTLDWEQSYFDSEKNADSWLKSKGF